MANTTPPTSSVAGSIFRGLIGCGSLVVVLFIVIAIGAVLKPGKPATVEQSAPSTPSTIVASIQDFQTGIPLLEQTGLDREQDPGGIEYRWDSGESWIKFYDFGADGRLDRISAVLATPKNDKNAQLTAFLLSLRIIQLASGEDISADAFNEWVATAASDPMKGEVRTLNKSPTRLQGTLTAGGEIALRITIGDIDG